jgi:prepilin-type N-terminal cleavage/methylation domain-containing protein
MRRAHETIPSPRSAARGSASRRAFTLLELLVALAMAGIIAGSLYSALRIGFRARTSAEAGVEPVRTAELATALLRSDFESALPATGTLAGPFVGVDGTGDGGLAADTVEFFTVGNPNDALTLAAQGGQQTGMGAGGTMIGGQAGAASGGAVATASLPAEARKVQIGLVAYPGAGGISEQVLVRRVTTNLLSQVAVEGDEEVLCRGVRSLNLRYYDGLTWQDNWDSTQLENAIPTAVEVVVELERSRDGQLKVLRFPRVFLLSCATTAAAATGTGQTGTGTGGTGGAP